MKVLLINPNTNPATTGMMVSLARSYAPADWEWLSLTAPRGAALIADPDALAVAAGEVAAMRGEIERLGVDAVIVAAFGDPGLQALRDALPMPVYGIGESALQAADRLGQPYSVLTIAPLLRESTLAQVQRCGCGAHFNTLVITHGEASATASSHEQLLARVQASIDTALHEHGSKVLVIGGGPVAAVAQSLEGRSDVRAILPLKEAVARVAAGAPARPASRPVSSLQP